MVPNSFCGMTPGVNLNIVKQDGKLGKDQKTFCFFLFF